MLFCGSVLLLGCSLELHGAPSRCFIEFALSGCLERLDVCVNLPSLGAVGVITLSATGDNLMQAASSHCTGCRFLRYCACSDLGR